MKKAAKEQDTEVQTREEAEERQRRYWEAWDRGGDLDPGDVILSPRFRRLLGGRIIRIRK